MTIEIFDSAEDLAAGVSRQLAARVKSIASAGRTPRLVLTGGTIAGKLYARLSGENANWSAAEYWWGDERFVPDGHEDRNERQAREGFLNRLGVPDDRIHAMPAHGCDLSMAEAADRYAQTLPEHHPFDVVLLGMGPDAHIASLFPGHPHVHETRRSVVEVLDSPKPPAQRLTLTFPTLNRTRATWFIVSGADKAEAVAKALTGAPIDEAPAAGARGLEETMWFLDTAAASKLPRG